MNINTGYPSIEQMTGQLSKKNSLKGYSVDHADNRSDFSQILSQKAGNNEKLTFSKHANQRLESRNIDLSQEQIDRLNDGARKAQEKGINDSLLMMDDMAFIVNIPNKTVVTALGDSDNKIITNIDGAVIV